MSLTGWRALLVDGRVISEQDPDTTPQAFLDRIVQFDVLHAGGKLSVRPDANERVIWRRRVVQQFSGEQEVTHVVGLLNRDSGVAVLSSLGPDGVVRLGFVDAVEFTTLEVS